MATIKDIANIINNSDIICTVWGKMIECKVVDDNRFEIHFYSDEYDKYVHFMDFYVDNHFYCIEPCDPFLAVHTFIDVIDDLSCCYDDFSEELPATLYKELSKICDEDGGLCASTLYKAITDASPNDDLITSFCIYLIDKMIYAMEWSVETLDDIVTDLQDVSKRIKHYECKI